MDATKGNIYAILNGNKQFLIPVYQRLKKCLSPAKKYTRHLVPVPGKKV